MGSLARKPAVAGQFYPEDPEELRQQIEACFLSPRGPENLPSEYSGGPRRVRAAIVPHAGYLYSGPTAARVFYEISRDPGPVATLILGVDHHGSGSPFALSTSEWLTPLGPVTVDQQLARSLTRGPIVVDESAHRHEHSIEVELPFLQYLNRASPFVPLGIRHSSFEDLAAIAERVRHAVEGKDVLVIASSDFSHYVPAKEAERLDRMAIDAILARDARRLYETVRQHEISMCGIAPVTVLLEALSKDPLNARLLSWGHSGEAQTMRDVVGYAGIVFESGLGEN